MKRAWVLGLVLCTSGMFLLNAISLKAFAAETKLDETQQDNVTSTYITDGTIVNADINSAAAIAGTKISPDFGAQNIVTTGNVGIGTATDPAVKVEIRGVSGAPATSGTSQANGSFRIRGSGTPLLDMGIYSASPYGAWIEVADSTNLGDTDYPLALQPVGGNVGIGTTGPGAKLDVAGNISISSGGSILGRAQFYAYTTVATSAANDTQVVITLNSEAFDIGGYFNTSTSRYTPPAGYYFITGCVELETTVANKAIFTYILKNGGAVVMPMTHTATGVNGYGCASTIVQLNGTDYVELGVRHYDGGTINANSNQTRQFLQGYRID